MASGGGAKRAGKAEWADRRRPSTRRAGYTTHPDATGGELQIVDVAGWRFEGDGRIRVEFELPQVPKGTLVGFGGWYYAPPSARAYLEQFPEETHPYTLTPPAAPNWSKFGSQFVSDGTKLDPFWFTVEGVADPEAVAFYDLHAGVIEHDYYSPERTGIEPERHARLMRNQHAFAPEANFVSAEYHADISDPVLEDGAVEVGDAARIYLKSCNRCARFLPINIENERLHLSFSNHCVAPHRRPCSHTMFGRLRDVETGELVQLEYGYQLECRFCKKFEVNAPHNPQRSAAQMKEDGARRRAIELLLTELYGGSPALLYRREHGGEELAETVFRNFEGRCFKCGTRLASERSMHLDHTRPLALLWPLDGTATALCATHNSEKRDRPPSEYYDVDELGRLSEKTGISMEELVDPSPNREAVELLRERLDWFFEVFLQRDELQTERDGKLPADLLVKAVQKAINRLPGEDLNLAREYAEWNRGRR